MSNLWRFLATVKLALFTLFTLAAASIIGTLIKQRQAPAHYVEEYGPGLAKVFDLLGFTNMYNSWWFIALLTLFAVNLIVCSIERLPGVWHMVRLDNLATDPGQLEKMGSTHRSETSLKVAAAADRAGQLLSAASWKNFRRLDLNGASLLFAQKGAWSRLGVYLVHLSILVVLAGAMIGSIFGYKAYVFLPEGRSTGNVFLQGSAAPVPLGFELQCDRFMKTFYPNGMVKEFRADLTVFDPERQTPYQKSVIVNDPLSWRGISFYQADSYPLEEYFVTVRNQSTGAEQAFRVPAQRDVAWPEGPATFRIEELQTGQDGAVQQARIRFATEPAAEPVTFAVSHQGAQTIQAAGAEYTISFRQLYTVLLLATSDPGVWIVYLGSILMIVGLGVCFLLSHQRIWIYITPRGDQGSRLLVSGASNKNKPAFERTFQDLVTRLEQDASFASRKKTGR